MIGTIPNDPSDDAERRGRHFKSSELVTLATDPKSHTPVTGKANAMATPCHPANLGR